jgi:hypothetical protein
MQKCAETTATATTCLALPCNDAALNFSTTDPSLLDLRIDPGESFCWPFYDGDNPLQIASCTGTAPGVVGPGVLCSGGQICKDTTPIATAACGAP